MVAKTSEDGVDSRAVSSGTTGVPALPPLGSRLSIFRISLTVLRKGDW